MIPHVDWIAQRNASAEKVPLRTSGGFITGTADEWIALAEIEDIETLLKAKP